VDKGTRNSYQSTLGLWNHEKLRLAALWVDDFDVFIVCPRMTDRHRFADLLDELSARFAVVFGSEAIKYQLATA